MHWAKRTGVFLLLTLSACGNPAPAARDTAETDRSPAVRVPEAIDRAVVELGWRDPLPPPLLTDPVPDTPAEPSEPPPPVRAGLFTVFHRPREVDVRDTRRATDPVTGEPVERPIEGTVNPAKAAQNQAWAAKSVVLAMREGVLLNELHRRFRELFAAPLSLPPLEDRVVDGKRRVLEVEIVWNQSARRELLIKRRLAWTDDSLTHYDAESKRLCHCISDDALRRVDEVPAAAGWLQKRSDQCALAAATRQLLDVYATPPAADPAPAAAWFEQGFPEFMGAVEVDEGSVETLAAAKWRHNRVLLLALMEARPSRDSADAWSLAALLEPRSVADVREMGARLAPGDSGMPSMFRSRAWAFCHFLWNYDDGKHRAAFVAYVGDVLRGAASDAKFAASMGAADGAWDAVEREFAWYWFRLLGRKVGKSRVTGQWPRPETDAPEGRVDDDEHFCAMWAAEHPPRAK